jgi:S-methylmethionine-dependent homocysteine/selenocysteine methylase
MAAEYTGASDLHSAFRTGRLRVLDGATGTELERRGVACGAPLWSAWGLLRAPDQVRQIHADYVAAGVDALVANTFRTQARALGAADLAERAAQLTRLAVRLAREAAARSPSPPFVLGSCAPLEDCYQPQRVPDDASLAREHAEHARNLVAAGVDAVLVETMNCVREALAASRAARDAGATVLVSFVCDGEGRLLSGEPLAEALDAVRAAAPLVVGVNCLPPSAIGACLPALRSCGQPFLIQPNLGAPTADGGFARSEESSAEEFADLAAALRVQGASLVGGCCGTTPAHLAALVSRLDG